MKYIIWSSAFCLLFSISSCNNQEEDTPETAVKRTIEIDTTVNFESERFEFVLPRPFALVSAFEEVGLTFYPDRTNPVENIAKYSTRGDQLINFGVYSADLIYCIINDQPQQSILYFNALKSLADKFGMGSVFTEDELALEIEKNIANREVLEELLVDVHERSQEYLEDNQMKYLSAIQFSGAWVEGMYLASFDFNSDQKDTGLKISDQMSLLKNTILGLQMYEDRDVEIDTILNELKSLESEYASFESVKSVTVNEKANLTSDEIEIITEKITTIRNLIIS